MWSQTGLKISDYFWLKIFHTISTSCSMPVCTQKPDIYSCICIYMYAKPGWLHHIHQNAYQGLPAVSNCLIIKKNLVVDANGAFWTEHHVHRQSLNSYTPETLHRLCDNINLCICFGYISVVYHFLNQAMPSKWREKLCLAPREYNK